MTNLLIELNGDVATAESYCITFARIKANGDYFHSFVGARMIDRLERRDGIQGPGASRTASSSGTGTTTHLRPSTGCRACSRRIYPCCGSAVSSLPTRSTLQHHDLLGELTQAEQVADPVALLVGFGQLRRVAVPPPQFPLDRGGPVPPRRGCFRQVPGLRLGQRRKVHAGEQCAQLVAGREVVSLRRIVKLRRGRQVDQQADPPAWARDPAHLPQHGELGLRAGRVQSTPRDQTTLAAASGKGSALASAWTTRPPKSRAAARHAPGSGSVSTGRTPVCAAA